MSIITSLSATTPGTNAPNFGSVSTLVNTAGNMGSLLDPSKARLSISGLASTLVGPNVKKSLTTTKWLGQDGNNGQVSPTGDNTDWRVKVALAGGNTLFYNDPNNSMLKPLLSTGGVVFPITPTIQTTHNAKYSSVSLTHSNYPMQFYEGSEVANIMINGEFPIQNIDEGQYLLAVLYFFRSVTKMFWGGQDTNAGAPPPLLYLTGYGEYYFPNVPCVLTSFMHTLPDDKDYIDVPSLSEVAGNSTRLPTQSTIQIVLQPLYSRTNVAQFNLNDFANGDMLSGGFI